MEHAKSLPPKGGPTVAELILRGKRAHLDLASSPPNPDQAFDLTRALVSHWTQELSDDRLDSITQLWLRWPLPVCAACVHLDGIAAEKIRDPRTGRTDVHRFVPSDPQIRAWLNQRSADLHEMAKVGEIAGRPITSPPLVPEWTSRTAEDRAQVNASLQRYLDHVRRSSGLPTPEEERAAAERFLQSCKQEGTQ
jgi:hypothetical protein